MHQIKSSPIKSSGAGTRSTNLLAAATERLLPVRLMFAGLLLLTAGCGTPVQTDAVNSPPETSAPVADADAKSDKSDAAKKTDSNSDTKTSEKMSETTTTEKTKMEIATFGGGCFWCTEAVFQQIKGVEKVVSGYCNGQVLNPTYEQVCSGRTGHAEVIQITYDPSKVDFAKLLEVHFKTHNPTTLNQQGADRGTQYRSGIYCHSDKQKTKAESIIKQLDASGAFGDPIVTEVVDIAKFYPAEDYHQNYYSLNAKKNPYCQAVIVPKMEKFKKTFANILKDK